jgi:L-alanine-DL-glutamate epimerase-like enolase superfamily enzyme
MIKVVELDCSVRDANGARPAAIVRARGESGAVGLGEAQPLPGRSPDTVDDCARAVAALRGVLPITLAPKSAVGFAADLASAVASSAPAARFAIESALCDLVARTAGWPLARLLAPAPGPAASVPINALCATPGEAIAAIARGIRCVKVKARGDLELVRAIRAVLPPDVRLRVDANQAWSATESVARLEELAALGVEYVEEPTAGLARGLRAPLAAPIALDESLASIDSGDLDAWLDDALASRAIAALVLKPSLVGGLTACLALAGRARAHGVGAVVTHAFDGPIATAAACELARAIAGAGTAPPIASVTRGGADHDMAHGLDRPDLPAGAVPQLGPASARDSGRAGIGILASPPRAAVMEVSP